MPRPTSPNAQLPSFGKAKKPVRPPKAVKLRPDADPDAPISVPRSPAQGTGYPRRTELWWPCLAGHVIRMDWLPSGPLPPHDTCRVLVPEPCGAELLGPYPTKADALADPDIQEARTELTRKEAS